jgi:PEP-CTERM motif
LQKTSKLRRLTTRLLSTTCLTVVGGVAAFGGSIAIPPLTFESYPGDVLPAGTTQVTGTVNGDFSGTGDFFELTGLPGGASFSSINLAISDTTANPMNAELFSDMPSAETVLVAETSISGNSTFDPTGTIPTDGNLFVNILPTNQDESPSSYSVTLTATGTPEPASLATIGLGLAGLGALALRRTKKNA